MTVGKKKAEPAQNSTVKIDRETAEKLNIFCRKHSITKKDFISLSLEYFERTGVDIRSNEVVTNDLHEIKEMISGVYKLQADAAVKLTGIAKTTEQTYLKQEDTTRMLEAKEKPRKWWQRKK